MDSLHFHLFFTRPHTRAHTNRHSHTYAHTHMHTCTHMQTLAHMHVCLNICLQMHACMRIHEHIHVCMQYTHIHVHAHTQTCTHVYAHTCMHTHVGALLSYRKNISAPKSHLPCTQLLFISFVGISKLFGPACGPTPPQPHSQWGRALLGEGTALLAVGCGFRQPRPIESDLDNMGSANTCTARGGVAPAPAAGSWEDERCCGREAPAL